MTLEIDDQIDSLLWLYCPDAGKEVYIPYECDNCPMKPNCKLYQSRVETLKRLSERPFVKGDLRFSFL